MASLISQEFKLNLATGAVNLTTSNWYMSLLMNTTTADTEANVNTISGYTTLGETAGANYARQAITGEAVARDDANGRVEWDFNDVTFASLGNGAAPLQGCYVYHDVDNDGDAADDATNEPGIFNQFSGDQSPGGSDFVVQPNAEGFLHLT